MSNGDGEGQASVELALVLPIVAMLFLCLVQVSLVVRDQVLVTHAAREAAREAAVDPSADAARRAALAGAALSPSRVEVRVTGLGQSSRIGVEVAYRAATTVPLVGALVPDVTLSATAAMRREDVG